MRAEDIQGAGGGADGATCRHTALQCLAAVARHHGLDLDVERLVHDTALTSEPDAEHLAAIARSQGLTARAVRLDWETLTGLGAAFPAVALLDNGNAVILSGCMDDGDEVRLAVVDPLAPQAGAIPIDRARFAAACSGQTVLLKRRLALGDPEQPFGLRWFVPEILRQRSLFIEIGVMALVLNALALAVPIFFQLVIDKVLVHHAISTLYVIGAGVLIALVFEAVLGYLRSYFLLYATTRIDVRLVTRTFGHLLALPTIFFESSAAGVMVKHMQQASVVREFLTGRLFLTVLDASVLVVFIPTLAFYSLPLTGIVIGFSLAICAVIGALIVPYRRRLAQLYRAEGSRQALLVETIHGMPTIKALGLEARQRRQWDGEAAHAIERHFEVGKIAMAARQISALPERLMMVAVVWGGVEAVFAPALDGVSLAIPAGTFLGIVGPSGSGKTTLTRLIQTLLPVQSGIIRFDGTDVREMDLADIRRQMGVVLQDAFLFRGSVRDNIAATKPGASLAEIMEAARQAGAQDFIELLPQGFDTLLEEGATNLSGGQKQRLAIARALLRDPPVLILDEATSALDPESEAIVVANLERFARQRTTIAISHRLTTIRGADMILVLDRGRVVGQGRHEALLRDCPLYRQLWGQQTSRAA